MLGENGAICNGLQQSYGLSTPCQDAQRGGNSPRSHIRPEAGWPGEAPIPTDGYFRPSFGWGGVRSTATGIYQSDFEPNGFIRRLENCVTEKG